MVQKFLFAFRVEEFIVLQMVGKHGLKLNQLVMKINNGKLEQ